MENFEQEIEKSSKKIIDLKNEISKKIIWQQDLIESIIICILSDWHILLEWLPGLAKTLIISTISKTLDLWFNRIQFTPDLLPSDLIWTEIFNQKTSNFDVKKWPIFNNFILADEINRAPSKVQSALLEAMSEKSITIWKETFVLDRPFLVLATQNPIEQSGTYKLPEAQLDRFFMKVKVNYLDFENEKIMYQHIVDPKEITIEKIFSKQDVCELQNLQKNIFVSDSIFDYVTKIIDASRNLEKYWLQNLQKYIDCWISPRWWISLLNAAKSLALMSGRSFVIPEDIKKMAKQTLSHRLILSYEAIIDEISDDFIIENIISKIEI